MQFNFSEGLSSAFKFAKNIMQKEQITPIQDEILQMSLSLIALSKRFIDIRNEIKDLNIIKDYKPQHTDIFRLFLAKREDEKHYLYAGYVDLGEKFTGIFIPDNELDRVQSMQDKEAIRYFESVLYNRQESEQLSLSFQFV